MTTRPFRFSAFFQCLLQIAVAGVLYSQPVGGDKPEVAPQRATLALSPAVSMLRVRPGQSVTQTFTLANQLPIEMRFAIETQDVVVRDGKRTFVPAGQIPLGIAFTAIAAPSSVVVPAGQTVSASVTVTVPPETAQRAVVVFFKGQIAAPDKGSVGFGASLGALITFNISNDSKVSASALAVSPQTSSANLGFSMALVNSGVEPVVPKGVIAILDEQGKRIAKATFEPHRLLPGESGQFATLCPAVLKPGRYRTLSSFEYEGKVLTNAGEFTVSE
ncbi:hypothetical protein [Paludibaculum fermentans]|uniref:Pili assembly chaperone N-terminal domain-containing protein n=1 Tax=Paludibaculum fermentans TaxID=1473598 RepID=A0A7S7SI29_PALFE|nr:hypothetical protein [Paludibaculum fermentans]QOY86572.1 hypothetical protein IRI77_27795 [Paludibaculum fermentans]